MEENKKRQILIDILAKLGVESPGKLATDRMVKKAQRRLAGGFPDGLTDAQQEFIQTELGVGTTALAGPSEGQIVTEAAENIAPPTEETPAGTAETREVTSPKKGRTKKAPKEVAEETTKKTPKKEVAVPEAFSGKMFYCKGKEAEGKGRFTKEGFLILKNSVAKTKVAPSAAKTVGPKRKELLSGGILVKDGEGLRFAENHLCRTPSGAAAILLGSSANGMTAWKDGVGKSLKEIAG